MVQLTCMLNFMTISYLGIELLILTLQTHSDRRKTKHFHTHLYKNLSIHFNFPNLFTEYCIQVTGHHIFYILFYMHNVHAVIVTRPALGAE